MLDIGRYPPSLSILFFLIRSLSLKSVEDIVLYPTSQYSSSGVSCGILGTNKEVGG